MRGEKARGGDHFYTGNMIVPFFDMANHHPRSLASRANDPKASSIVLDQEQRMLLLYSTQNISRGAEFTIEYGRLPNPWLLHYYGFCIDKNIDDKFPVAVKTVEGCRET
jgi:hypothetical protein